MSSAYAFAAGVSTSQRPHRQHSSGLGTGSMMAYRCLLGCYVCSRFAWLTGESHGASMLIRGQGPTRRHDLPGGERAISSCPLPMVGPSPSRPRSRLRLQACRETKPCWGPSAHQLHFHSTIPGRTERPRVPDPLPCDTNWRLGFILVHTPPALIHHAEIVLGRSASLFHSLAESPDRLSDVLADALPTCIHHAEIALGIGVPGIRRPSEFRHR